jgi:hypothetical protein
MFAFTGLALYWLECQYLSVLILRLNANISVWMFGYFKPRLDIEVECQMLFGWSKQEIAFIRDYNYYDVFFLFSI